MKQIMILAMGFSGLNAMAQSSVTIGGHIDARYAIGTASGAGSKDARRVSPNGMGASRIAFRGREDLGGGQYASFWLEAAFNPPDGSGVQTINSNNTASGVTRINGALTFNRKSLVSLGGPWGSVAMGRDYVPNFGLNLIFDPFANAGAGSTLTTVAYGPYTSTTPTINAANTIAYHLPPNIGGLYGFLMYFGGDKTAGSTTEGEGSGRGIRLGYANKQLDIVMGLTRTKYHVAPMTRLTIGGSYELGFGKLQTLITRDEVANVRWKAELLGISIPVGVGEINAAVSTYKQESGTNPTATKYALGYVHNFSKRTAVYTAVAHVKNKNGANVTVNSATLGSGDRPTSSGMDIGIRHLF
ncbi:MAG: porin [Xanthomonadaceae bacterium]|nr:porin [Xanthomonadaceae bacterium]